MNEISRFVLFEVGRANVGDARHRPTTSELLQGWNARVEGSGIGFVGAVGHTGNYIVETGTSTSLADLTRAINLFLHIRVAAFDALHFAQIVAAARNVFGAPPTVPSGRRPTAGLVMDLNAEGGVPPSPTRLRAPDVRRLRSSACARCVEAGCTASGWEGAGSHEEGRRVGIRLEGDERLHRRRMDRPLDANCESPRAEVGAC